jgi:hypothetical protein
MENRPMHCDTLSADLRQWLKNRNRSCRITRLPGGALRVEVGPSPLTPSAPTSQHKRFIRKLNEEERAELKRMLESGELDDPKPRPAKRRR